MIRVLIADDEPLARARIRDLLAEAPDMHIVAEAENGQAAVDAIRTAAPNVVFLDIAMPLLNGLEVVTAIGRDHMPLTVFLTAYDQYAVTAFEAEAVDYLLKPFDDLRFAAMLARVRTRLETRSGKAADSRDWRAACLVARSKGRRIFIPPEDIIWVRAAGDYAEVHAGAEAFLVDESLSALSQRLPGDRFARIHRSGLVRLDQVREVRSIGRGDAQLVLRDGAVLRLSRLYRAEFMERLETARR